MKKTTRSIILAAVLGTVAIAVAGWGTVNALTPAAQPAKAEQGESQPTPGDDVPAPKLGDLSKVGELYKHGELGVGHEGL